MQRLRASFRHRLDKYGVLWLVVYGSTLVHRGENRARRLALIPVGVWLSQGRPQRASPAKLPTRGSREGIWTTGFFEFSIRYPVPGQRDEAAERDEETANDYLHLLPPTPRLLQ